MNLYVHPSRGRRDRPARRTTDQSSEPASGLGPDALTSNWIAVKQLTGRVGGGTKRRWRSHRRRRRRASRRRRHRQPKEGKGWTGGLGSADGRRRTDEVRGKGDTRLRIIPKGFNPRNALESAPAPHRAARSDPDASVDSNHLECRQRESGVHGNRGGPGRGDTHGEDGQGSATGSLVSGGQGHHGGTLRGDGGDRASAESLGLAREGGACHDGGRSGGNGSHFDLRGVQRLA